MLELDRIICGDCLEVLKTLPAESVDCCITSPPYYGLRDYGVAGQIGLEATPEAYISRLGDVFREVRRVLKDEGTLWLNLGDSFCSQGGERKYGSYDETTGRGDQPGKRMTPNGLKPKDLIGVPWLVAFALRADGWYLRSDIIWHKPNCMPESVTDRPTKSHEYLFLLSKSQRYYYDAEAIKEECVPYEVERRLREEKQHLVSRYDLKCEGQAHAPSLKSGMRSNERKSDYVKSGRNKRTVWTIPTRPYKEAHFATFPEALVEPCILAGTSERGYCPECGKPWVRQVEKSRATYHKTEDPTINTGRKGMNRSRTGESDKYVLAIPQNELAAILKKAATGKESEMEARFGSKWAHWIRTDSSGARIPTFADAKEIYDILGIEIPFDGTPGGWLPSCQCASKPRPGIVLDPFSGAGTVALVAKKLGRHYIGIELNPAYVEMAKTRINKIPARLCRWVEGARQ